MPQPANYTTYVPGKPLSEQLIPASKPTLTTLDLCGIPYRVGRIAFRTLKVNERYFELTLHTQTAIGAPEPQGIPLYQKYTFDIKSIDREDIDLKEVPSEEIEERIKQLFQSSKR